MKARRKSILFLLLSQVVPSVVIGLSIASAFASKVQHTYLFNFSNLIVTFLIVLLTYFLHTRLVQPIFLGWPLTKRFIIVGMTILMAIVVVPFLNPVWDWEPGPEVKRTLQVYRGSSWGSTQRVLELHAAAYKDRTSDAWSWQAEVDLSDKFKGIADHVMSFRLTQPEWAVIDQRTGEPFKGPDGVFVTFKVMELDQWTSVQSIELKPVIRDDMRRWHTIDIKIPAAAQKLRIEVLPGTPGSASNNWNDRVWIGTEPEVAISQIYPVTEAIALGWLVIFLLALIRLVATPVLFHLPKQFREFEITGLIDKHTSGSKHLIPKKRPKVYLAATLVIMVVMIPISVSVAPWYHAATTPVQLELVAPSNAQIDLCWTKEYDECLPLVPYIESDEKHARLWLGELPPSPSYHVSLVFQSPVEYMELKGLTLVNTQNLKSPVYQRGYDNSEMWFVPENLEVSPTSQGFQLYNASVGRLYVPELIRRPQSSHPLTTCLVWLLLSGAIMSIAAFLFLRVNKNTASENERWFSTNLKPIFIAFGFAALLHLLFVANSHVIFTGDSGGYGSKAIQLAESRTYDTGEYQFELIRMPGYPFLLAVFLRLSNYDLTIVTILQGIFLCISVLLLALSLRRWLHPAVSAICVATAILSPVQIWGSKLIMSESAFATFATLSLAAFFEHIGEKRIAPKMQWLIAFAILGTSAVFIRPNGVVLFVPLILIVLPQMACALLEKTTILNKGKTLFSIGLPYSLTIIILIVAILGWSVRNYYSRDYFAPTEMTGVTLVEGLLGSGFFAPRSFLASNYPAEFKMPILEAQEIFGIDSGQLLYRQYLRDKYRKEYLYQGWNLRETVFKALTENREPSNKTISLLDYTLKELARESNLLLPWQSHLAALLRVGWWAIAWPPEILFDRHKFRYDYKKTAFKRMVPENRTKNFPPFYSQPFNSQPFFKVGAKNLFMTFYFNLATWYYEGYFILLVLAFVSSVYLFWYRRSVVVAPFVVFVVNIFLNMCLLGVRSRYIHILDIFLVFQVGIGFNLFMSRLRSQRLLNV